MLVVDRDDAILHLCSYVIIQNGMSSWRAWEPVAAFTILSETQIDLVVSNLEFSALSGIDLAHHVHSNYPDTQILVMTPFGDVEGAVRAIRGGATDYLTKPFSVDEFQKKLKDWEESRGAFRKWARSQPNGLPEERTLAGPPDMSLLERHKIRPGRGTFADSGVVERSRHAAIVNDAVCALRQIIQRDIQETALFAAIDEEELLRTFLCSIQGARAVASPEGHDERSEEPGCSAGADGSDDGN